LFGKSGVDHVRSLATYSCLVAAAARSSKIDLRQMRMKYAVIGEPSVSVKRVSLPEMYFASSFAFVPASPPVCHWLTFWLLSCHEFMVTLARRWGGISMAFNDHERLVTEP
jgi:hypothetical protein